MAFARIDMQRLRDALPKRAALKIKRSEKNKVTSITLDISVADPGLEEDEYEMVKGWHADIIKAKFIAGFFVDDSGKNWHIDLGPGEYEFMNTTDDDKKNLFKK